MDIATTWDPELAAGDWGVSAGQLTGDAGLRTAVVLSLMTDATAHADDALEVPGDRRGWWGDLQMPGDAPGDRFGSRLWLLRRAKRSEQTRRRAEIMCREALAWLVTDGVASGIEVAAGWQGESGDQLAIAITIQRPGLPAAQYDVLWRTEGSR